MELQSENIARTALCHELLGYSGDDFQVIRCKKENQDG